MRVLPWVLAFFMFFGGALATAQGLALVAYDGLRGSSDSGLSALHWASVVLGVLILLFAAALTTFLYSVTRPWQRRRKGTLAPTGFGWLVAGATVCAVTLLNHSVIDVGNYDALQVEGDLSWSTGTWVLFFLPYACGAVLFILGAVLMVIGLPQHRADGRTEKEFGRPRRNLGQVRGRIIGIDSIPGEQDLERVVVEVVDGAGALHIFCVTDNAGGNGWMLDPEKRARVQARYDTQQRHDPRAWAVAVGSRRRLFGARLLSREVRQVSQNTSQQVAPPTGG